MKNNQLRLFFCFLLFSNFTLIAATEQLLISENFQGWTASSVSTSETTKLVKSMYGEDITYAWKNCAIIPTQVAKSDNSVTSVGAVQTNKVAVTDQYFTVSGFATVTRAILKHSYTGSARGCIIQVKGDGDADWVTLFSANTTNAAGQSTEIPINRTNVSIRFTGNNAGQKCLFTRCIGIRNDQ